MLKKCKKLKVSEIINYLDVHIICLLSGWVTLLSLFCKALVKL